CFFGHDAGNTDHMSDTFVSSSSSTPHPADETSPQVDICFVCTGNICRSPMAEVIAHDAFEDAGLDGVIRTSSCGLGGWHVGQKADKRAIAELRRAGHDGDSHRAAKLGPEHMGADVFIAMGDGHGDALLAEGGGRGRSNKMRSVDE